MTDKAQRIVLAARPEGAPKPTDFRLEDAEIPTPSAGEFAVEVIWLSLDPYMRGRMDDAKSYAKPVDINGVMEGQGVGRVIASNNSSVQIGDYVLGGYGWQSHAVSNGEGTRKLDPADAPISTAVGVMGMPGLTAFVGLNDHGRPKKGETLVVSAASGAVGSLVGQLGKIYGLNVVGVAGGAEKCRYVTEELGFDACIDHRSGDAKALRKQLAEACPDGVDIYFENVGGKTLEAVIPLMNIGGRIPVCGMIAWYSGGDAPEPAFAQKVWRSILTKRLSVRGFIIFDHFDRFPDFVKEVGGYLREGRIQYRESITQGLENAPSAFMSLLEGGNFGKQLVQIKDDPTRDESAM